MPDLLESAQGAMADTSWDEVAPRFREAFPGLDPEFMRRRFQETQQTYEAPRQQQEAIQLLQTHAESAQPQSWETLAPNFQRRFPLADQSALQASYVPMQQNARLQEARARLPKMYDEPLSDTLLRWLPGGTTALNAQDAIELNNSTQRFNAGRAQRADYDVIARHQAQEETDKKLGVAGEITRFFSRLPGLGGELLLGGAATGPLAERLGGGVVGSAVATAAATPLVPSLYTDRWIQNNIDSRRDPLDVRGLPAALGLAAIQNAMLGGAGAIGGAVGPAGNTLQAAAGRVGVGVGAGIVGQQVADAVTSTIDRVAQATLGTSLNIDTGFGRIGQLLNGHAGDALRDAVKDGVMFAAFGLLHELGRKPAIPPPILQTQPGQAPTAPPGGLPSPGPTPQPGAGPAPSAGPTPQRGPTPAGAQHHPVIKAMVEAIDYLKAQNAHYGFQSAAEKAGNGVKAVSEEFMMAIRGNPEITRADLRHMFSGMRDNPLRDYAFALADNFPERPASGQRRPAHPEYPPAPPPDVQEAQVVTPEGIAGPNRPLRPEVPRGTETHLEAPSGFGEPPAAEMARARQPVEGEVMRMRPEAGPAALAAPESRRLGPPHPVAFEKRDRMAALHGLWQEHEAGKQVTADEFFKAANLEPRQEYILRQRLEGKSFPEIAKDPNSGVNNASRAEQVEQEARDLLGVRPGNSIDKLLGLARLERQAPGATKAEIGGGMPGEPKEPRGFNRRTNDLYLSLRDAHERPTEAKITHLANELAALDRYAKKNGQDLAKMIQKKSPQVVRFVEEARELITKARRAVDERNAGISPVLPRTQGPAPVRGNAVQAVQAGAGEPGPAPAAGPGGTQAAPAGNVGGAGRAANLAKARAAKMQSVLSAAKARGGIDRGSVIRMYGEKTAREMMVVIPTIFKNGEGTNGTRPIDLISEEMQKAGEIPTSEQRHAHDILLEMIQNRAFHLAQDMDAEATRMEKDYLRQANEAKLHPSESAQAIRAGQEDASLEAPGGETPEGGERNQAGQAETNPAAQADEGGAGFVPGEPRTGQLWPGDLEFDPGQLESGGGPGTAPGQPGGGGLPGLAAKFWADEGGQVNLGELGDELRRYLAPASRGPEAKEMAGIVRENLAILRRKSEMAIDALAMGKTVLDKLLGRHPKATFDRIIANAKTPYQKTSDFLAFMDQIEGGTIQNLPPGMREIAQTMRDMFDERERQLAQRGLLKSFIENYFGHLWEDPAGKLSPSQIGAMFAARRPLPGSESYKRHRTIPTYSEGILLGLTPKSYNPVELALLKLREIDKSIMGRDVFEEAQRNGLTQFIRMGDKGPPGWVPLDDKLGRVFAPTPMGLVQTGNHWMPEPAAALLHNYLSPGLTGKSQTYDIVRGFSNMLNQFQLGFSAFHLGFVAMDTQVSAMSLAVQQLSRGQLGEGLKSLTKGIIPGWAPIEAYIKGSRILREYYNPNSQGALMMAMVDSLMKGGGSAVMDRFYGGTEVEKLRQALTEVRAKNFGHVGGLLARAIPAFSEMISKPVMEHIVPRMKLGVFFDMANYEMDKLGPNAKASDMRAALGKAWDSVENRLGQLTYDNLFWNRTFKDALMVGVRSVGWNVGTVREGFGGLKDIPSSIKDTLKGQGVSPRTGYIIALPMVTAIFGAIAHYLMTGKRPEEAKDYFFPKTGKTRKDGSADRMSMPSYMRDVAAVTNRANEGPLRIASNLWHTAKNKVNPGLSTVIEMLNNENFYGSAIYDPGETQVRQAMALARHLFTSFEPFVLRNIRQGQEQRTGDTASAVRGFFGMTAAPSNVVHTWDEQRAREAARRIQLAPLERLRRGR